MRPVRPRDFLFLGMLATVLAGCSGGVIARKEIEGNNTGGIIPFEMIKGGNIQSLADAHCAKYKASARITYNGTDTGGDVVFVCEVNGMPAMMAAPAATQQAPATR